ncbi:aminoglycoside phosphotransferase family protein [Brevibacillus sp. NRS-1366]|uniref:aminoglycoside phosphotransferase family protein n=1 Tax=Brevibacillus sp. NRS-1366 TaxID=3233899 RepID=UPI003D1D0F1E
MNKEIVDIMECDTWTKIELIQEGWSKDKKYYIENKCGQRFLLRVSDRSLFEAKRKEFEVIKKFNAANITMSKAVSFGYCNNGLSVYMLLTWVDGTVLDKVLPTLTNEGQYDIGVLAGKALKTLHTVAIDESDIEPDRKEYKLGRLKIYENSTVRIDNDKQIIAYVYDNIHRIGQLPPVYKHGDYHVGNLLLTDDRTIGIIDFNRWGCGDKYEDFYKVQSFDVEISVPFAVGQINGYFDDNPPKDFWDTLAVYVAHSALCMINWAEKYSQSEVIKMQHRCKRTLSDYNYFSKTIPNWYSCFTK